MADKELDFETAMKKLEESASKLENSEITLDEAMKCYEEGIKYYNRCEEILKNARQKIQEYNKNLQ